MTLPDDIQLYDDYCPKCGSFMYWQQCTEIDCQDGMIDLYEEDPLCYEPGDAEICQQCDGKGHHIWCSNCGYKIKE